MNNKGACPGQWCPSPDRSMSRPHRAQADDIHTLKLLVKTIDKWVEAKEHGEFYTPNLPRSEKLRDCIYIIDHIIDTACVNETDIETDKLHREFWLELSFVVARIKNTHTIELLLCKPLAKVIEMLENSLVDSTLAQFVDYTKAHHTGAITRWTQFIDGVKNGPWVKPPCTFAGDTPSVGAITRWAQFTDGVTNGSWVDPSRTLAGDTPTAPFTDPFADDLSKSLF